MARAELLDRGLAVVGRVGPVAVGGEGKNAVAIAAGGVGLDRETGLALIDVGDVQRTSSGQIAGDDAVSAVVFGHGTGGDATDHRHVVGAEDQDGDEMAGAAV